MPVIDIVPRVSVLQGIALQLLYVYMGCRFAALQPPAAIAHWVIEGACIAIYRGGR